MTPASAASAMAERADFRERSTCRVDMFEVLAKGAERHLLEVADKRRDLEWRLRQAQLTHAAADGRVRGEEQGRAHQHEVERDRVGLAEQALGLALADEAAQQ